MTASILIIDQDEASREQIRAALTRENMAGFCEVAADAIPTARYVLWVGDESERPSNSLNLNNNNIFSRPVRLGQLLSRVQNLHAQPPTDSIAIGPHTLDCIGNILQIGKTPVRLTDKEKQILVLLAAVDGKTIPRQKILDSVWGYVEGLETHTLETHIYRLRQKIEADPASPALLLTEETGYRLAN